MTRKRSAATAALGATGGLASTTQRTGESFTPDVDDVRRWARRHHPDGEVPVYFCTVWDVTTDDHVIVARPMITRTIYDAKTMVPIGEPVLVPVDHIDGGGFFTGRLRRVACRACETPLLVATVPETSPCRQLDECPLCEAAIELEFEGEAIGVYVDPIAEAAHARAAGGAAAPWRLVDTFTAAPSEAATVLARRGRRNVTACGES